MWTWLAIGAGVVIGAVNVMTMRRLWRSIEFERSQKVAQTILLWLVPGSFVAVRHVLPSHRGATSLDSTAGGPDATSGETTGMSGSDAWVASGDGGSDGGGGAD